MKRIIDGIGEFTFKSQMIRMKTTQAIGDIAREIVEKEKDNGFKFPDGKLYFFD